MKWTIIFIALLTLAGCADIQSSPIPGGFELSHRESDQPGGDGLGWANAANTILTNEALKDCPQGFTKLNERVIATDRNTTIWRIKCL